MNTDDFRKELARYVPLSEAAASHIVLSGSGSYYTTIDGKTFLDFSSGIYTNSFGHSNQEIAGAVYRTLGTVSNIHGRQWVGILEFCRRLFRMIPYGDYRAVFFGDGGAYAVDRAFSELYYFFGKRKYSLATFDGGFHGKTQACKMALDDKESSAYFHASKIPAPYCFRCPCKKNKRSCSMECVSYAEEKLAQSKADVFLFEPILGSAVIVPPADYWRRIQDFCRANNILMLADEVLTAGGRTGTFTACENYGITPDILIMTKGLANGLPLSAMLIKPGLAENPFSSRALNYSSTFMGVPALMAAASEVLRKIESENIIANVKQRGSQLAKGLAEIQGRVPEVIGDVRSIGLMAAVEFVKDDDMSAPDYDMGKKVFASAENNGLELIPSGHVIRIGPPLNITAEDMSLGLRLLEKSIEEAVK